MEKQAIAKALKKARINADMTCKEVGLILGKSEKTISAWEHCNGQPDAGLLFRLCELYKISSVDEMLGNVNENNLVSTLRVEEKDLVDIYRCLTTNSKQIVMTVAQMELSHIHAVKQGETPISILQKSKRDIEAATMTHLSKVKVFSQSAAAGLGNLVTDSDFEMITVASLPQGTEFGIRISGDSMQPQINDGDIVFVKRQSGIDVGEIGIFIFEGESYCKQLLYRDNIYYLHSLNNKYKDIPILSDHIYTVGLVLDKYTEN
ncbi:MAG: hypothetical protein FWC80_07035 [Firmicutes bacterium]|nr:hypothetical protein [Bacillota bacterium]